MKHPVCLGDPTSGGGEVVSCQMDGRRHIGGRAIAVVGDLATCLLHPGRHAFVEGSERVPGGGRGRPPPGLWLPRHRRACYSRAYRVGADRWSAHAGTLHHRPTVGGYRGVVLRIR